MGERADPRCRDFTGYRPCTHSKAGVDCPEDALVDLEVLLINLDAMGDVLRTTALLPAIRRQHPRARITWLTLPRAAPLLGGHPQVDRVLHWGLDAQVELSARRFDLLLNVDKSRVAGGLAMATGAAEKRGFGLSPAGAIVPLNTEADYLYRTGLDDELKFHINQKTEPEMLAEAMGFAYAVDPYRLHLSREEAAPGPRRKVGFNTGCSPLYPYKKLPLAVQAEAISRITAWTGEPVLLLGGPEDTDRNAQLAAELGDRVEATPTEAGLRRGAAEVDRCQVVVSGDSLGMHMAIALEKHVVVWFGPTCAQEIELYGRGVKLQADVTCSPCWRQSCDLEPKCFNQVEPARIEAAVRACIEESSLC